jgi:hypothetical protein
MDTRLSTVMSSEGWISTKQECETDSSGRSTCRNVHEYDRRSWGGINHHRGEIIAVAGLGVRFFKWMRLEYLRRFDAPVGDGSTDFSTGYYISLSATSRFLKGE